MAQSSIFSTYRAGENRVTGSMLAVFERLEIALLERILGVAIEDDVELLEFRLQPVLSRSTPDARIKADIDWLFEVKTQRGALTERQLADHLLGFGDARPGQRLIALTPDDIRPEVIDAIDDERCVWVSFVDLTAAIDDALADGSLFIGEQTRFLLRSLRQLFVDDGLLEVEANVVVVPARSAYPEYVEHGAYIHQPHRAFKDGITNVAFYRQRVIERELPRILRRWPSVTFTDETADHLQLSSDDLDRRLGLLIPSLLAGSTRVAGSAYGVMLLEPADDPNLERLRKPIAHHGKSAWAQNHRYIAAAALTRLGVTTTDDL